jgi:Tfp pilus assembly protein PilE
MFLHANPSKRRSCAGVTMIEIAVVVLVVAGLMAAILSFKEVTRLSILRKVAVEAQSFGTAARAFEQKYEALPGDFADASTMLPDCAVDAGTGNPTNVNFCRNGNGDGHIGRYCHFSWTECFQTGAAIPPADQDGLAIPPAVPLETSMFWKHLYLGRMITVNLVPTANPAAPRWKESHPGSAIEGNGYVISGGGGFIGGFVTVNILATPTTNPANVTSPADLGSNKALSVRDAMYLDEKYDNNGPGSGAMWWNPIGSSPENGCRRNDGNLQNTWERDSLDRKNCVFSWTVY